jgi:hypothetical protein
MKLSISDCQIAEAEKRNSGSSITEHPDFDRLGCLVIKNLYDVSELKESPPKERGVIRYGKTITQFTHTPVGDQVEGSLSRYNYPPYKKIHTEIRLRLEKILRKKLYNTYYYDRYYFPGQKLDNHVDRDACEISVTLHIASNPSFIEWPICIKTAEGFRESAILDPGDALLYKGCERPHWREELQSFYSKREKFFRKLKNMEDDTWYHQVFFHYVLSDGYRLHYAGDNGN